MDVRGILGCTKARVGCPRRPQRGDRLGTVSKPMSCPGVPSPFALFVELLSHVEAFILLEPDVAVVCRPLH